MAPISNNDPKGSAGAAKLPMRALPEAVLCEAAIGMGEGMVKYGLHNWRHSNGVETMTYVEAARRHLAAFVLGEDIDEASGLSHITKAITSLMVLRDAQIHGCAIDNRQPPSETGYLDQLNEIWARTRVRAEAERQRRLEPEQAQDLKVAS